MTKTKKIILISILAAVMVALVVFCVVFGIKADLNPAKNFDETVEEALQTAKLLYGEAENAWKNKTAKTVTLADNNSISSDSSVKIQENKITISSSGTYIVSGYLSNGQLLVNCNDTVILILNDAQISNSSDAAISISDAKHTLIYLPEGSSNMLISGTETDINSVDAKEIEAASGAALYSRDSLSFAGNGKLTTNGYINNAISTTNHLIILCGELKIAAVNNGLKGNDSVTILDGKITINSAGDGIQTDKDLSIEDGTINITAGDTTQIGSMETFQISDNLPKNMRDMFNGQQPSDIPQDMQGDGQQPSNMQGGMQGSDQQPGNMQGGMRHGDFNPQDNQTPPEMPNGQQPSNMTQDTQTPPDMPYSQQPGGMQGGMQPGGMQDGDFADMFDRDNNTSESASSSKGIKSENTLTINGGNITINSLDDSIHSNGSITISKGTFLLATADDGIHANDTLTILDGDITISQSNEGFEAHNVFINGGNISITASDDGLNAYGGSNSMFGMMLNNKDATNNNTDDKSTSSLPLLKISGGNLYVNARGDGLDSNGDLIIEGGTTIVDGPSDGGNGALDSGTENGGSLLVNGGIILAIGASNMAETFESTSKQYSFIQNYPSSFASGTKITIIDQNGKTIFEHTSAKSFNSIVFSSPELALGSTYTITVGNQASSITIENISNENIKNGRF